MQWFFDCFDYLSGIRNVITSRHFFTSFPNFTEFVLCASICTRAGDSIIWTSRFMCSGFLLLSYLIKYARSRKSFLSWHFAVWAARDYTAAFVIVFKSWKMFKDAQRKWTKTDIYPNAQRIVQAANKTKKMT